MIPDAFICANDNIAAGLMDAAICFNPQITTVSHKREILAGHCMELFDKIWRGKPVEQCHYIEPEISYTESCGCPFLTSIDYREGARRNITENAVGAFRFGGDEFVALYPLENKETEDEEGRNQRKPETRKIMEKIEDR